MPIVPTYPGVYIQEISSGVRTITGVSTSVAAFVDYFRKGRVNDPVQIFNMGDFEREFGGLDANSEASYAIQQFFLNGGTEAWVVRVVAGATVAASSVDIGAAVAGAAAFTVQAISEGTWGNSLRVKIDGSPGATSFDMTVSEYATVAGRTTVIRQEKFTGLTVANAINVVNDEATGSALVRITAATGKPLENGTVTAVYAAPDSINVPAGAQQIQVAIGADSATAILVFPSGAATVTLRQLAVILEDAIRSADAANPAYSGAVVTVVEGNRLRIVAGPTAPADRVVIAEAGGTTAADFGLLGGVTNAQQYTFGVTAADANTAQAGGVPGDDGTVPTAAALIGSLSQKTGIFALEDVDLFNLLCIPRASIVGSGATDLTAAQAFSVMSVAIAYCQGRRAFFVMDTPRGVDELNEIRNWMQDNDTLRNEYAAIYYPRVTIPDPLNEFRPRSAGASGTMAGVMARTDSSRGVWKAPAGTDASLRGVSALEDTLTDAQNGALNPLGINCLRTFPIYGSVAWGARTLDGADAQASEYKYVPIRRLANFLEESLYRGTKWVIFEPNDEPLWAQIRLNVTAFMQNLFRQGAFQGQTPREAYFVRCDAETTTQNDRNLGIVNLVVGFAPLKPAEFLIITIQQIAGQLEA